MITARFDERIYRVQEYQGSVSPRIVLDEPSPCCFILHAQLSDGTAHGGLFIYVHKYNILFLYKCHRLKSTKQYTSE